jgi:HEAT repeat protein
MISPPARQDRPRPGVLVVVLLAMVAPGIATLAAGSQLDPDPPEEDPWKNMEAYVNQLATSDPRTKRELAESSDTFLRPLFDAHPDHDDEDVSRVVDSLRLLLRNEKDDWIMTRVLEDILFRDGEALLPLFLEALRSHSPNLSWCGIRWFSDNKSADALPELLKAWDHEERPWVIVDLITALAEQGSRDHVDDFIELARGKNRVLSSRAIEALATLEDERAIRPLAEIAREGLEAARIASLEALTTWPEDRDALDAVLLASRSENVWVRARAARSLASFAGPDAEDRLVDLALSTRDDKYVRAAAVEGMGKVAPGRAIAALVEILQEPAPGNYSYLHSQVMTELRDLDDPSILEALQSFVPDGAGFPLNELSDLQGYLARDRRTQGREERLRDSGCTYSPIITDPNDPDMIAVTPPPWLRSIRCWRYPGIAWDPGTPRLPAGTPVRIEDHFELGRESWVGVSTRDMDDCWVPMRFIEHPPAQPAEAGQEDTMLIRREFDVPASEAESDIARGLMDAGLLEVIEPGDDVIGVAITVDPGDFDMVFLLAKSCGLEETLLDDQIDEIVQQLAPLHPEHPALDRFRRPTVAEPPETDTLIDLDIEELTDH